MRTSVLAFLASLCMAIPLTGASHADEPPGGVPQPVPEVGPDDRIESDRWYAGSIDDKPLANIHEICVLHADGSRSTWSDMETVLRREVEGKEQVMRSLVRGRSTEDAEGLLCTFHKYEEEDGTRIAAIGRIEGDRVIAVIHRGESQTPQELAIPEGVVLRGDHGGRRRFRERNPQVGDTETEHSLTLDGGRLEWDVNERRLEEILADGGYRISSTDPEMPGAQIIFVLDPTLELRSARMSMGPMELVFEPAEGPVPLQGATFSLDGAIKARGPMPHPSEPNRYRLPAEALARVPQGPFQRVDDGALVVLSEAAVGPLEGGEGYLAATGQLETGDPAMRAWVGRVLADAPQDPQERGMLLAQAVRKHLVYDLSRGDASALESFRDRRGDCSEFANLLAAACRIDGIPARVEGGLVFVHSVREWCGHAWVSAYDRNEGRWFHLDAAYVGIGRSCYIGTESEAEGAEERVTNAMGLFLGAAIEVVSEGIPEGERTYEGNGIRFVYPPTGSVREQDTPDGCRVVIADGVDEGQVLVRVFRGRVRAESVLSSFVQMTTRFAKDQGWDLGGAPGEECRLSLLGAERSGRRVTFVVPEDIEMVKEMYVVPLRDRDVFVVLTYVQNIPGSREGVLRMVGSLSEVAAAPSPAE